MKYIELIKNKYAMALLGIIVLAILLIMATSELTALVVIAKIVGFSLMYSSYRLYKVWDAEHKVDIINELFNDDDTD